MAKLAESEQCLKAIFFFPEEFVGFQGHFPGNKILPGVCQIECVIAMLEIWKREGVALKEIIHAKFFSPVLPLEEISCECKDINKTDGEFILSALLRRGDDKVSELKLRVCFTGKEIKT